MPANKRSLMPIMPIKNKSAYQAATKCWPSFKCATVWCLLMMITDCMLCACCIISKEMHHDCADLQVRALGAHPPKVSLPDDFHWQTYIKLWPDLKQAISTQRDAEDHYVSNGALEHRVYRDYALAVRYTSCSGLINQHYSHLAGIALAMALQADTVIVPPALARDSFKSYFSTFAEKNEVQQLLISMYAHTASQHPEMIIEMIALLLHLLLPRLAW
jgi:hypothetical protein